MSLHEASDCGVQQHQERIFIIKTEPVGDDKLNDSLLSLKMKREYEENHSSCNQSSKLKNLENNFSLCPIKKEPKDSPDDIHEVQTEKLELKEEINIEDNKPGWELIEKTRVFNDGLVKIQCDAVQENVIDHSVESKNQENNLYLKSEYRGSSSFIHAEDTEVYKYYKCEECSLETRYKSALTQHYKIKHAIEPQVYKCQQCSYETRHKSALTQHYKIKHAKEHQMYKCEECSFESSYKNVLTRHHKRKHREAEVYKCEECSYETRRKDYFTQHFKYNHSKVVEVYKCEDCSFETRWKGNLAEHYNWKHAKEAKVYKCKECSFETRSKPNVTKHYKYIHAKEPKVYKCEECSYETKRKSHLTRHSKCKHGKEKLNS